MNEVIRIPEVNYTDYNTPLELTDILNDEGWVEFDHSDIKEYDKIVYLGRCDVDGDLFAGYSYDIIDLFKGNLNSGKY